MSRKGAGEVSVSLEACSGCFAIFQMHDALVDGDLNEECLPPLIGEQDAAVQGRRQLLQVIMRRRGQYGKPVIEELLASDVFYYPFWVYYFQRRGKYGGRHSHSTLSAIASLCKALDSIRGSRLALPATIQLTLVSWSD